MLSGEQVDVNSLDNFGRNALQYAERNQNGLTEEIVSRLKEKGAVKGMASGSALNLEMEGELCLERKKSDAAERNKQVRDPLCTAATSMGLQIKFPIIKRQLIRIVFNFLLHKFVLKAASLGFFDPNWLWLKRTQY